MAWDNLSEKYIPRENKFYRNHYHHVFYSLIGILLTLLSVAGLFFYQITHRPLPHFSARAADGKIMTLSPYKEPNLLPDTIIRWASKAATLAYTFNFTQYREQMAAVRPYFTNDGWRDYVASANQLLTSVISSQLFINGVVSDVPVISNQGPLPNKGYTWRIQIPFIVTYQSANTTTRRNYVVIITIVRVPTFINPQGIGIDQFVMVSG
jgi:intracellular multiplication protein IcmL